MAQIDTPLKKKTVKTDLSDVAFSVLFFSHLFFSTATNAAIAVLPCRWQKNTRSLLTSKLTAPVTAWNKGGLTGKKNTYGVIRVAASGLKYGKKTRLFVACG